MSNEDQKTLKLYKKVLGILNKLTPEKFETLLVQMRSLRIDTKERLQGVIDLVFEKAVDEPNFSVAYALMCRELALMQVPASNQKIGESVNFIKLLVTRCQLEFEKNSVDKSARNVKMKEIEACTDPQKKNELQLLLEEEDRRIRRKSVGNIRFIGELFKQQMLTVNVMLRCLNHLLENEEEGDESLECLSELLTTVGKEVEDKKVDLNPIFFVIGEIVNKKRAKVTNRVRFRLQDVIDLRNSKWIPRRQDINPKTIDQMQREANEEQLTIQLQIDEPFGSSQMFGTWGRGSSIKPPSVIADMYAALEDIGDDIDKRSPMNYSSKDPYNSEGTSLERPNYECPFEDGRGSRSGSQHRLQDNSQRSKPIPTSQQNLGKGNPPTAPRPRQPPLEQISPKQSNQLQCKIKNILEGYLNDCYTVSECVREDTSTSLLNSAFSQLVSESYICVLEISSTARLESGTLFAHLIKRTSLSVESYCTGLEEVLSQVDNLLLDIPKIWDYLAELIAPMIYENAVSLVRLHKSFDIIIKQDHASKLLDPLFKLVVIEKGPNYLHSLWESSGLNLSDFMISSQVNSFIQQNQFEFLLGGTNTVISQTELTYEQIHQKLLEFFENDNTLDDIFVWIEANIGERVKEKQFVRTLATAVFEDSIVESKLKTENLRKHYSLLKRIVDGRIDHELESLDALQALINKLEHPQGIFLSICGALYNDSVFSHDSFVKCEIQLNKKAKPHVQPLPNQSSNQGLAIRAMAPTGPPSQASTPPNSDLKVSQISQSMNLQPHVQPLPNQSGNQGLAIRAMAPTGPPTQASTPPNSDLKVSQMSQSMNLAFVPPVRPASSNYFGQPLLQSQPLRMPNHRIQGQQLVFPPQQTPFMQPMAPQQPLYCVSYYVNNGQGPMVPQYYPGQPFTATSYPQTPQQTQTYINSQYLPRVPQPPVVAAAPQNLQHVPLPRMALARNIQPQTEQKKQRPKTPPIIDPESGKDKLDEIFVSHECNPSSGESSARQTPQPHYINKEVQNTFTKQVNMVINQEKMNEIEHSASPSLNQHIDTQSVHQTLPPTQDVQFSNRNDLVQSSKLQVGQHTNTAKEVTPTLEVSANMVTAEVAINKQNTESPVESRKQRELLITKEIKEPPAVLEKKEGHKINKEEFKIKESTSPPVVTSITLTSKDVKEANNQMEEKKTQKKDKTEQKKSPVPSPEIVPENISQQNSLSASVQENVFGESVFPSKPMPTSQQDLPTSNPPIAPRPRQPQRKIRNILEEHDRYMFRHCVSEDICTSLLNTAFSQLVSESYICVLEISSTARLGSGTLFAHLIKRASLSVENYCTGLEEVLSQVDNLSLDIPEIWNYLAELIAPMIYENAVSLVRLNKSFDIIIKQGHASKLLGPLFKLVVIEQGENYLHSLWGSSGLNLSDFMMSSQVNNFIQENQLEFLLEGTNAVINQTELTYEQIHQKLLEFFETDYSLDDIFVWIEANIGQRVEETQFVRTLATAVFEDSIVTSKLKTENLWKHYWLLRRIVGGRIDFELECLYALQALINKLEHPKGILLSICGALYNGGVFSRNSFIKWEASDNPTEQDGKDIIFKQLVCFFLQLREDEEMSEEDA